MRLTPEQIERLNKYRGNSVWDGEDVRNLLDTIDALQSDVAAARSETLAEAAKIARDAERLHGVTFGTIPALILKARSRDTTHLSEIRELEIRIAEAKWWKGMFITTPNRAAEAHIANLEQQLEVLKGESHDRIP